MTKQTFKLAAVALLALPFLFGSGRAFAETSPTAIFTIYYEDGTAATGAKIIIYDSGSGREVASGQTDANGTYKVSIPKGLYVAVIADQMKEQIELAKDQDHFYRFTIRKEVSPTLPPSTLPGVRLLDVYVIDALKRSAVPDAYVTVTGYFFEGKPFEVGSGTTGNDGHAKFKVGAADFLTVVVNAKGYYPARHEVRKTDTDVTVPLNAEQKIICKESYSVKPGSANDQVRELQLKLKEQGYLGEGVRATGYYGDLTKRAIENAERDSVVIRCYPTELPRPIPVPTPTESRPTPDPKAIQFLRELAAALQDLVNKINSYLLQTGQTATQ